MAAAAGPPPQELLAVRWPAPREILAAHCTAVAGAPRHHLPPAGAPDCCANCHLPELLSASLAGCRGLSRPLELLPACWWERRAGAEASAAVEQRGRAAAGCASPFPRRRERQPAAQALPPDHRRPDQIPLPPCRRRVRLAPRHRPPGQVLRRLQCRPPTATSVHPHRLERSRAAAAR
ncbi:unnamed protein product [Urochloa humidicola]